MTCCTQLYFWSHCLLEGYPWMRRKQWISIWHNSFRIPWYLTILSIYNFASCQAIIVVLIGINWVDFVNWSTTTQIESFFLNDFRNPNMKSQVTHSYFQSGIKSGFNKPPGSWCSTLTCWNVKHLDTKPATSLFMPINQWVRFISWYVFFILRWLKNLDRCASNNIDFLKTSSLGIHNLPQNLDVSDFSMKFGNFLLSTWVIFSCSIKSFDLTMLSISPVTYKTGLIAISSHDIAHNLETWWWRDCHSFWLKTSVTTLALLGW